MKPEILELARQAGFIVGNNHVIHNSDWDTEDITEKLTKFYELAQQQALKTAVRMSEGALDYSGGYRYSLLEAYRAGIQTVTTCLKAYLEDKNASQVKALIGVEQKSVNTELLKVKTAIENAEKARQL